MSVHGYLRISTSDKGQNVENQRIEIKSKGYAVDHWYVEEGVSGSIPAKQRPEFSAMLSNMVEGDILVTVAVDRLGRNAEDILNTINTLEKMKVGVSIISLGLTDVTSPVGKAIVGILSSLAEMEKAEIVVRVKRGLTRVKAEGRILGPRLKITPDVLRELCQARKEKITLDVLSAQYGLDRNTISQNVVKWGDKLDEYEIEWSKREAQYKAAEESRINNGRKAA
jgi:DNA invertase Pin-like site-specific DNA recombinase